MFSCESVGGSLGHRRDFLRQQQHCSGLERDFVIEMSNEGRSRRRAKVDVHVAVRVRDRAAPVTRVKAQRLDARVIQAAQDTRALKTAALWAFDCRYRPRRTSVASLHAPAAGTGKPVRRPGPCVQLLHRQRFARLRNRRPRAVTQRNTNWEPERRREKPPRTKQDDGPQAAAGRRNCCSISVQLRPVAPCPARAAFPTPRAGQYRARCSTARVHRVAPSRYLGDCQWSPPDLRS